MIFKSIGILPFLSFKNTVIELNDFVLFTDLRINEINQLSETLKAVLKRFSNLQKEFIFKTFNNSKSAITFVQPTSKIINRNQLELFFEIILFYLHKGGKFTNFFSTPNAFCREDFKYIIIDFMDDENIGGLTIKKKWKFQLVKSLDKYIIPTIGCENIVIQNEDYNYLFRNIELDYNSDIFRYLYRCLVETHDSHILRAITFYNRAMSCGRGGDKKARIKEEVNRIILSKNFISLDKENISKNVEDLITIIYDYRSSYIHGSDMTTDNQEIKNELKLKFGNLDFVSALMNLISNLFLQHLIPDNKFEGVLNVLFKNQEVFEKLLKIFVKSADKTLIEFKRDENRETIYSFLNTDLQSLTFDSVKVKRCMDNILHIFAKFAKAEKNNEIAIQIQQKIDSTDFKDKNKFEKWNSFFNSTSQITPNLEALYLSKLVFQTLYDLLKFDTAIY